MDQNQTLSRHQLLQGEAEHEQLQHPEQQYLHSDSISSQYNYNYNNSHGGPSQGLGFGQGQGLSTNSNNRDWFAQYPSHSEAASDGYGPGTGEGITAIDMHPKLPQFAHGGGDYHPQPQQPQQQQQSPSRSPSPQHQQLLPQQQQQQQASGSQKIRLIIRSPRMALILQCATTFSTILLTVIPVVFSEKTKTWGNWYSWRDAVRLAEPFCSGLLHCWFFYNSDMMRPWAQSLPLSPLASNDQDNHPPDGSVRLDIMSEGNGKAKGPIESNKNHGNIEYRSNLNGNHGGYNAVVPDDIVPSRQRKQDVTSNVIVAIIFTVFFMLYLTGGALHTAAAFFKNTISLFLNERSIGIGLSTHPLTKGDGTLSMELAQQLKEGYLLMQDTWEHNISHYMYALGAMGMSWCEMYVYSRQNLPPGLTLANCASIEKKGDFQDAVDVNDNRDNPEQHRSRDLVAWWVLAGVLYGAIVAGVACQYPKGLYVGSVYVGLLFIGTIIAIYVVEYREKHRSWWAPLTLGRHYILQSYLIASMIAAVIMVIYMAVNNFDMLTSNDKSYLSSISRP